MSITFTASTDQEKVFLEGKFYNKPIGKEEGPNFANANAVAVLSLLNLFEGEDDYVGEMPLNEMQCAIDIAHALWDDEAVKYIRDEEREGNFISFGLDEKGLKERFELLAVFVMEVKKQGATTICWS